MRRYTTSEGILHRGNNRGRDNNRGWPVDASAYTLLEVMVALVIMGIAISAVAGALSSAKGLSGRADDTVEALRVLQNVLNDPLLLGEMARNDTLVTSLEGEDEWRCTSTAEPLTIGSSDLMLFSSYGQSAGAGNRKKGGDSRNNEGEGDEIEVTGMVRVTICLSRADGFSEKSICLERWVSDPEG